jgi:predicted amidohydrolase YtcJ
MQIAMHAIGDRANRIILDIYDRIARENGPRDRRDRIEHVQHLKPADIPRIGELKIVAACSHITP